MTALSFTNAGDRAGSVPPQDREGERVKEWRDFEPTHKDDFFVGFYPPASPLILNGKQVPYDLKTAPLPQIGWGDLLVPARWLVRHVGGTLSWDQASSSAVLHRGPTAVTLFTHSPSTEQTGVSSRMRHSQLVVSVAEVIKALGGTAKLEHNPTRVVATFSR